MYGKIDIEDAIAGTAFALSAAVSAGVAMVSVQGHALSDTLWTVEGTTISLAFAVSVVALGIAYVTNRVHGSGKTLDIETDIVSITRGSATIETYVLLATLVVLLVIGLDIMGLRETIQSEAIFGWIVLLIEGAGYYVVSYLG